MENFIRNQCGERLAILNTENIKIYFMNNKNRGEASKKCNSFSAEKFE